MKTAEKIARILEKRLPMEIKKRFEECNPGTTISLIRNDDGSYCSVRDDGLPNPPAQSWFIGSFQDGWMSAVKAIRKMQ